MSKKELLQLISSDTQYIGSLYSSLINLSSYCICITTANELLTSYFTSKWIYCPKLVLSSLVSSINFVFSPKKSNVYHNWFKNTVSPRRLPNVTKKMAEASAAQLVSLLNDNEELASALSWILIGTWFYTYTVVSNYFILNPFKPGILKC